MAAAHEDDVSDCTCQVIWAIANWVPGLRKAQEQDGPGRVEATTR
jgi:hypothetical protein